MTKHAKVTMKPAEIDTAVLMYLAASPGPSRTRFVWRQFGWDSPVTQSQVRASLVRLQKAGKVVVAARGGTITYWRLRTEEDDRRAIAHEQVRNLGQKVEAALAARDIECVVYGSRIEIKVDNLARLLDIGFESCRCGRFTALCECNNE